jgi:transposase
MGKPIIDDELWALIEPLLPPAKPRRFRYPGRLPVSDRAALSGILFVLRSGIRWNELPSEMGCGSGVSCWHRLRDWQSAGVSGPLYHRLAISIHRLLSFDGDAVTSSSLRLPLRRVKSASLAARSTYGNIIF